MKHIVLSTALTSVIALSGAAMAQDMKVKEIDVQTDLTAIQNAEAATVWHDIDEDLETAIIAHVSDRIDDAGAVVRIDIDEVSLANNFELATGLEKAELKGWVKIDRTFMVKNQPVEQPEKLYELTVSAQHAEVHYPEGTDLADIEVGSQVFYEAMIAAFAENVARKIEEL